MKILKVLVGAAAIAASGYVKKRGVEGILEDINNLSTKAERWINLYNSTTDNKKLATLPGENSNSRKY